MQKIKRIVCAVALATTCMVSPAHAGLQGTMESIFNSMTNVSKPGVYEGIRRGVVTGGGVSIHNRIVSSNILSIAPPDWRGGCGGIDFFGGSFSFINADQFVQLMRAVAANAAGYAFSLAIDAISHEIGLNIKNLVAQVQEWVRLLSNSCELAMTGVDALGPSEYVGSHWQNFKTRVDRIATTKGTSSDDYASKTMNDTIGDTLNTEETKRLLGNIVYRSMVEQSVTTWFPGGDRDSIEEMMSLLGTVIVTPTDKVDGKYNVKVSHKPSILSFRDLVEGGENLHVYKCASYESNANELEKGCIEMVPRDNATIISLQERFEAILLGPQYRSSNVLGGIVMKLYDSKNGDMTQEEKNLLVNLGPAFSVPIQKLTITSPDMAALFVREVLPALTIDALYNMTKQLSKAVREAVQQSDSSYADKALKEIDANERKIYADVAELHKQYGSVSDALRRYEEIRSNLPDPQGEAAQTDAARSFPIKLN